MSRGVVLLIAYHFPPSGAIGGARPHRFYKYLKRLGYECHVITAAPQTTTSPDIEFIPDIRGGIAWQAERVAWKFLLRAELVLGWSQAAWRAGRDFLNSTKAESVTIISTAPPVGTHLAAWRLARYSGHPWIADFRDPLHSSGAEMATFQHTFGPAFQQTLLNSADLVLANTDSMKVAWGDGEKIHVLWNGFDPEDTIATYPLPLRPQKILSHVGELYGGRDIRPIVRAVNRLGDNSVKVVQVGEAEAADLPKEKDWFELRKPVPAAEARAIAVDSDGLLLIQPQTAVQVPGKLFDYIRMGRPIFGYVVRDSPVERILARAGIPYDCIYPGDTDATIDLRLQSFLSKLNGQVTPPSSWFTETFEASSQVAYLDQLIASLH